VFGFFNFFLIIEKDLLKECYKPYHLSRLVYMDHHGCCSGREILKQRFAWSFLLLLPLLFLLVLLYCYLGLERGSCCFLAVKKKKDIYNEIPVILQVGSQGAYFVSSYCCGFLHPKGLMRTS